MLIEPESGNFSIVLIGNFNPRIFTPDWFARHGILTDQEADSAEIEIVHEQLSKFKADWLGLTIETRRFVADTSRDRIQLLDFVVKTFKDFLSHTPVGTLGINRSVDFNVGSIKTRDKIGYQLAPPDAWGDWSKSIYAQDGELRGGMASLVMRQSVFENKKRPKGFVQATVQPSQKIKNSCGIHMLVNNHYEIVDHEKSIGCEEVIDFLEREFEPSIKQSEKIIDQIMRLARD